MLRFSAVGEAETGLIAHLTRDATVLAAHRFPASYTNQVLGVDKRGMKA